MARHSPAIKPVIPYFQTLLQRLEFSRALSYSLLATVITSIGGPLVLFFVTIYLSPVEQGYFYTFASLAGLTVFVELGVAQTISVSISHLASRLQFQKQGTLSAPHEVLGKLSAHFRFYLLWYLGASIIAFLVLSAVGMHVLESRHPSITWVHPWLLVCIGASLGLPLLPLQLILFGLGTVQRVLLWRLITVIIRFSLLAACLVSGLGLFAQGISLIGVAVAGAALPLFYLPLWKQLWEIKGTPLREVARASLSFQWKVAISWISGYTAMYLLTPLLFSLVDPTNAGRFGATYTLANAAATIGLAWINVNVPRLGGMVSTQDVQGYRQLSKKLILLSGLCGVACLSLLIGIYLVAEKQGIGVLRRFLSLQELILLSSSCWCYMEFNVLASLLRCFRNEPLFLEALLGSILLVTIAFALIPAWGVRGAIAGHLIASLVILVAASLRFRSFLTDWQSHCPTA